MAEVVYMRCSTRPQAVGHSLERQLQICLDHARRHGLVVGWVYCDIGSGAGRLPQRDLAIRTAMEKRCHVLVESSDRWSRSGVDGGDAWKMSESGRVITCCEHAREQEDKLYELIGRLLNDRNVAEASNGR